MMTALFIVNMKIPNHARRPLQINRANRSRKYMLQSEKRSLWNSCVIFCCTRVFLEMMGDLFVRQRLEMWWCLKINFFK